MTAYVTLHSYRQSSDDLAIWALLIGKVPRDVVIPGVQFFVDKAYKHDAVAGEIV